MANVRLDDTVAAISTPVGEGGIGIVRLSGKDALKIADKIFLSRDGKKSSKFETYTVHYGHIVEKEHKSTPYHKGTGQAGAQEHKIVDEVILTVMRSPKSYTKEDVVEINCHSGIVPLKKILDLVLTNGARLAEPGEFTKRAYLNGRIDITQAESVLDIIRAKTDLSLRAAINSLGGRFSRKIQDIRNRLMDIFTHIEASLDFSEEKDVSVVKKRDILNKFNHIKKETEESVSSANEGRILRQGVTTVICGSPNVGKSSLMNAILKESRAIVTHLPGTTRDTIEEFVGIKGIPLILVDTAGISSSSHPATKEGIKRSRFSIQKADLVLFVLDYGRKLNRKDIDLISNIRDKEVIVVINKVDLERRIDIEEIRRLFPKRPMVRVSALRLSGIDRLEEVIQDVIFKGKAPTTDFVGASNDRQVEALRRSLEDIKAAIAAFKDRMPMDCVGVYVRSAIEDLGEITGHTVTEEALDRIFSEFCIGK